MLNSVSQRLEVFITKNKISQSDLALTIGVNRQTVNSWFKGTGKPKLEYLISILESYPELNFEWLLLGRGDDMYRKNKLYGANNESATVNEPENNYTSKPDVIKHLESVIEEQKELLSSYKTILDKYEKVLNQKGDR